MNIILHRAKLMRRQMTTWEMKSLRNCVPLSEFLILVPKAAHLRFGEGVIESFYNTFTLVLFFSLNANYTYISN